MGARVCVCMFPCLSNCLSVCVCVHTRLRECAFVHAKECLRACVRARAYVWEMRVPCSLEKKQLG